MVCVFHTRLLDAPVLLEGRYLYGSGAYHTVYRFCNYQAFFQPRGIIFLSPPLGPKITVENRVPTEVE